MLYQDPGKPFNKLLDYSKSVQGGVKHFREGTNENETVDIRLYYICCYCTSEKTIIKLLDCDKHNLAALNQALDSRAINYSIFTKFGLINMTELFKNQIFTATTNLPEYSTKIKLRT
eukprot:NODE_593_length_6321_cov_0.361299.p3 type:complete len:117 gc:universal NODE_593_length_6321_cov_0.361299:1617-1967(+)